MDNDVILVIVVATALAFDFTNGFHDTANVVATAISTRALSPRFAVTSAALLNFVGAFISLEVAATVAKGIVDEARRLRCGRVVMATARKNSITRMLEDSVTNKVLEQTSVPVEIASNGVIARRTPLAPTARSSCSRGRGRTSR